MRTKSNASSESLAVNRVVDGFRTVSVRKARQHTAFLYKYLPYMMGIEANVVAIHKRAIRSLDHTNRRIRIFFQSELRIAHISFAFTRACSMMEKDIRFDIV